MCGIAGILGLDKKVRESIISLVIDRMEHRGPDADGIWSDKKASLGHKRLSIIDLTDDGNQPLIDASGRYIIVFNGEIYNYKSLKGQLKNFYDFKTATDTEVLLASYIKWGVECLQHLNGMFSFAIWDSVEEELFIARDRIGIKPLYYFNNKEFFLFASELRSILASGLVEKEIRISSVEDYLTYQTVHAPFTIVENVYQLMPGEYALLNKTGFNKVLYWDIANLQSEGLHHSYKQAKNTIEELLLSSVESQMVSDVPLGAFLSGGIDSSAIVALMSEVSTNPVNTFSIVFNEKEFDESKYSRLVAKKYKTNHTELLLTPKDFLNNLPRALKFVDSPSCDGVNTYTVSKLTKEAGIKVSLTGLGGDELFAGYSQYYQWYRLNKVKFLWNFPMFLRQMLSGIATSTFYNHKIDRFAELLAAPDFSFDYIFPIFRKIMVADDFGRIGFTPTGNNVIRDQLKVKLQTLEDKSVFAQSSVSDIMSFTQNILLRDSDQMSMACSIELRVPFFDHKLVEYVLSLPDHFKFSKTPKKLLVDAISPRLPDEIVFREKKGFSFPWDSWIRNELKDFCYQRLCKLSERGIFQQDKLLQYWDDFLSGDKKITWIKIWSLVTLSEWMENNGF